MVDTISLGTGMLGAMEKSVEIPKPLVVQQVNLNCSFTK